MILNQRILYLILSAALFISFILLLGLTNDLSISYKEAEIFFKEKSFVHYFTNFFTFIFGQNDYALRVPFIVIYFSSIYLIYRISENYFSKPTDRIYAVLLFMFLPGFFTSAILVNSAVIVIFLTLLYLYIYKNTNVNNYLILFIYLFIDNAFAILFLSLVIHSFLNKDYKFSIYNLILFSASLIMFGFESSGKPHSYFLDTFAIFASIFSPLVFIYFLYTIYRIGIKKEKSIYWLIPTTALLFSLLLSFRQKILIEDFAPFLVIATPMMTKLFLNSYRVRLRRFRLRHNILLTISLAFLIFSLSIILLNKKLYFFLDNPKKNFAYKYHFAKEIASTLKNKGINNVKFTDKRLGERVSFYGIDYGTKYYVSNFRFDSNYKPMQITFDDKFQLTYYVKKNEK